MKDKVKRMVESLRQHAAWAKGNEWETSITLADDLFAAADMIEKLTGDLETMRKRAHLAEAKAYVLFYEAIRLRSRRQNTVKTKKKAPDKHEPAAPKPRLERRPPHAPD